VDDDRDLIMMTVPGVQRYIAQSRTTGDLVSASAQVSRLAARACEELGRWADIVFPSVQSVGPRAGGSGATGLPNRVVALAPSGTGAGGAGAAAEAITALWRQWYEQVFGTGSGADAPAGFPDPQWVVVPPLPGGYREQFSLAQRALAARRAVRSFPGTLRTGTELCSLSARWPAVPPPLGDTLRNRPGATRHARPHERPEKLGAVAWIKRTAPHQGERPRTPSTPSIASAPYRAAVLGKAGDGDPAVLGALRALHEAGRDLTGPEEPVAGLIVPAGPSGRDRQALEWFAAGGGAWADPERWDPHGVRRALEQRDESAGRATGSGTDPRIGRRAAEGFRAAQDLCEALGRRPATYLAVVVQDLDGLGRFLAEPGLSADRAPSTGPPAGPRDRDDPTRAHREISRVLHRLAGEQAGLITGPGPADRDRPAGSEPRQEHLFGVPVYAGGDDVLALAPAATALDLARRLHDAVPDGLPTASTAVFCFHQRSPLQRAVRAAQELLEDAKGLPGKHGLAIGFARRSGPAFRIVLPWAEHTTVRALLDALAPRGQAHGSPAPSRPVSPRLVFTLERDAGALDALLGDGAGRPSHRTLVQQELRRLVARHSGPDARSTDPDVRALAGFLYETGRTPGPRPSPDAGPSGPRRGFDPVPAARVAHFLRQEAR